jgi:hypothetical protein
MPLARADLESLLRDRKLLPPITFVRTTDEYAAAPTAITALDARLGGGFPRGQLSELVGPRSSGRTSVLLQMLAAATARQEIVALVDVLDMLDVASAEAAGVDLGRLLWIRGEVAINPGLCRDTNERALDRAIKALTLVLQAGNFGLVLFDAAEAPAHALQRLPFTTWRRLQRIIEGSQTACVLVGGAPIARSAGGVTVITRIAPAAMLSEGLGSPNEASASVRAGGGAPSPVKESARRHGFRIDGRLFRGLDFEVDIVRPHARIHHDVRMPLSTTCA